MWEHLFLLVVEVADGAPVPVADRVGVADGLGERLGEADRTAVGSLVAVSDAISTGPGGSIKLAKGFNALGAFQHFFTPSVSASVFGGYTKVNKGNGGFTMKKSGGN